MRLILAMPVMAALAGCQAPMPPIGGKPADPAAGSLTRQMIEGDAPPTPRSEAERALFTRARLVGMEHGAARAAVQCTATVHFAAPFLRLQEERERALLDMRDRAPDVLRIAAQASAGALVMLREAGEAGCATARRQALRGLERDPWRGFYGAPLRR